jgi:hypothetical protein
MRAEVAERSGLSIAAGGAVTALGGALLAVGVAQTVETNPLQNWSAQAWRSSSLVLDGCCGHSRWPFERAGRTESYINAWERLLPEAKVYGAPALVGLHHIKTPSRSGPIERAS